MLSLSVALVLTSLISVPHGTAQDQATRDRQALRLLEEALAIWLDDAEIRSAIPHSPHANIKRMAEWGFLEDAAAAVERIVAAGEPMHLANGVEVIVLQLLERGEHDRAIQLIGQYEERIGSEVPEWKDHVLDRVVRFHVGHNELDRATLVIDLMDATLPPAGEEMTAAQRKKLNCYSLVAWQHARNGEPQRGLDLLNRLPPAIPSDDLKILLIRARDAGQVDWFLEHVDTLPTDPWHSALTAAFVETVELGNWQQAIEIAEVWDQRIPSWAMRRLCEVANACHDAEIVEQIRSNIDTRSWPIHRYAFGDLVMAYLNLDQYDEAMRLLATTAEDYQHTADRIVEALVESLSRMRINDGEIAALSALESIQPDRARIDVRVAWADHLRRTGEDDLAAEILEPLAEEIAVLTDEQLRSIDRRAACLLWVETGSEELALDLLERIGDRLHLLHRNEIRIAVLQGRLDREQWDSSAALLEQLEYDERFDLTGRASQLFVNVARQVDLAAACDLYRRITMWQRDEVDSIVRSFVEQGDGELAGRLLDIVFEEAPELHPEFGRPEQEQAVVFTVNTNCRLNFLDKYYVERASADAMQGLESALAHQPTLQKKTAYGYASRGLTEDVIRLIKRYGDQWKPLDLEIILARLVAMGQFRQLPDDLGFVMHPELAELSRHWEALDNLQNGNTEKAIELTRQIRKPDVRHDMLLQCAFQLHSPVPMIAIRILKIFSQQ